MDIKTKTDIEWKEKIPCTWDVACVGTVVFEHEVSDAIGYDPVYYGVCDSCGKEYRQTTTGWHQEPVED